MKKTFILLAALILMLSAVMPVYAADGKVSYQGNAQQFIFEPGSGYSPTDLFPNFKDVMPGNTLTQKITVKNDASNDAKVKIYIRSLGAHEDSINFLSQLGLKVQKSEDNEMEYMFDAAAEQTAQLSDWVYLGMLYSGGEVNLDVTLDVPVWLGNEFQNKVGYLDWEFMIEEFPLETTDPIPPTNPIPPKTGDDFQPGLWLALIAGLLMMLMILWSWHKKDKEY